MKVFSGKFIANRNTDIDQTLKFEVSPNVWQRFDEFDTYKYYIYGWQGAEFLVSGDCDKIDVNTLHFNIPSQQFGSFKPIKFYIEILGSTIKYKPDSLEILSTNTRIIASYDVLLSGGLNIQV